MFKEKLLTPYVAGLIVLVFILQNVLPFDWGWVVGTFDITFFTAMIAHSSAEHLAGNLFALILFGLLLEAVIGRRIAYVLILAGIVGNLAGIGTYTKVIGISGAVYGVLGTLTVLRPRLVVWVYGLPMPMLLAGVIWTFVSAIGMFGNTNTGHLAHLAGILVGFLLGFAWRREFPDEPRKKKSKPDPYLDKALDNWERIHMR